MRISIILVKFCVSKVVDFWWCFFFFAWRKSGVGERVVVHGRQIETSVLANYRAFNNPSLVPYHTVHHHRRISLFQLEDSLAKVLALKHTNETLSSVVNSLSGVQLGLDAAVSEPLLQVLLVLLGVGRTEPGVGNEETFHVDLLGDKVHEALNSLPLVGRGVVLGDLIEVS